MRAKLAYKSIIEKLAENIYILQKSSTIQFYAPYGGAYGNVGGPIGYRDPLRRRFDLSSISGLEPPRMLPLYVGSTPKSSMESNSPKPISSVPKINLPLRKGYIGSTPVYGVAGLTDPKPLLSRRVEIEGPTTKTIINVDRQHGIFPSHIDSILIDKEEKLSRPLYHGRIGRDGEWLPGGTGSQLEELFKEIREHNERMKTIMNKITSR